MSFAILIMKSLKILLIQYELLALLSSMNSDIEMESL